MEIRSFSQLEKVIKLKILEAMHDEVAVKATQLGQENVIQEVYEAYNPTVAYQRTYQMLTSFIVNPVTDGIEFSHDRSDGDRNVSAIVEYGDEFGDGYRYKKEGAEYMNPRPFFSETKIQLENGEFKEALKNGLTKRGLTIRE